MECRHVAAQSLVHEPQDKARELGDARGLELAQGLATRLLRDDESAVDPKDNVAGEYIAPSETADALACGGALTVTYYG